MSKQPPKEKPYEQGSTYDKSPEKRIRKGEKTFIVTREIDADKAVSVLDKCK